MAPTADGVEANTAVVLTPGGMNAKERRAAKRKAQQSPGIDNDDNNHNHDDSSNTNNSKLGAKSDASTSANSTSSTPSSTAAVAPPAPTSAKERRAAKRAAERVTATSTTTTTTTTTAAASVAGSTGSTDPGAATSTTPTTAKERRAAKRAATRISGAATTTTTGTSPLKTSAAGGAPAATTAKERRLLRREEERKKREREGDSPSSAAAHPAKRAKGAAGGRGGGGRGSGGGRGGGGNPHIVFVGQLAFTTTAQGLEDHFRTRGGIVGSLSVRLLTRKGTKPPRSKGMAFVQVEDAESAYQCLGLHHSRLDGRLLNVERTSGGGKDKKVERLKEQRGEQKEFMKSVVQRVLAEFIDAGRLGKAELDTAAQEVLEKMEAKVMERAVKDYCDKPDRLDLHNPSAWFTHHAHELAFRADPEDLDAGARDWLKDEHVKAGGRSRDKEKAAKKARGERTSGGGGGGGGRGGGRSTWVPSGRGGRGRGVGGEGGRGGRGRGSDFEGGRGGSRGGRGSDSEGGFSGGDGGGSVSVSAKTDVDSANAPPPQAVTGARDQHAESAAADSGVAVGGVRREGARIRPPVDPAARDREGGGGWEERYPRRDQRDTSDLMSIFPSLRGRGGGRGGGPMAGRGGGGRGFERGGIRA